MDRGPRVSDATVRLNVDGGDINDQIVQEFDSAADGAEASGRDAGRDYAEGFDDGSDERFARIRENLDKALTERMGEAGDESGVEFTRNFGKRAQPGGKTLGERLGDSIGEALGDRLELSFANMIDDLGKQVDDLVARARDDKGAGNRKSDDPQTLYKSYDFVTLFEAARAKLHAESNDAIEKSDTNLLREQQKNFDAILKSEADRTKFLARFEAARAKLREDSNNSIYRDDQDLLKRQQALFDRIQRESIAADNDLWRVRRATAAAYYKFLNDQENGRVDAQGNTLRRVSRNAGDQGVDISDTIGKIFGAGSRNNFLNLFGSLVGNIIEKTAGLQRVLNGVFTTLTSGLTEAGSTGSKVVGTFGTLATSGVALAAVIGVITLGAGALVSVLSGLLGIVVALAATITSALAGAAIVGAGALGAIAVAGGLVAVAFTSMTDAQKTALSADFAPLKQELTGLGQLMLNELIPYFGTWSENLQNALYNLAPLANVFGDAIGRAGNKITESLSGPGFTFFTNQLAVYLPSIVTKLSAAFGSFLNGVAATFGAVLPYVNQFASYLQDAAQRFENFASSAEGQNSIVDFVDRALESLSALGDFIGETGGLISDLLFSAEGQAAGNSIFTSLANQVEEFRDSISRGDLERWFGSAKTFAEDLGEAIKGLSKLLASLNDSGTLESIGDGLQDIGKFMGQISKVAGPVGELMGKTLPPLLFLALAPMNALAAAIEAVESGLDKLSKINIGGVLGQLQAVAGIKLPNLNFGSGSGPSSSGRSAVTSAATGGSITTNNLGVLGAFSPKVLASAQRVSGNPTKIPTKGDLIQTGTQALQQTSESSGGYKPDPKDPTNKATEKKKPYKNPYVDYANQIIASTPAAANAVQDALHKLNNSIADAIRSATSATSGSAVTDAFASQIDTLREQANANVTGAQQDVVSAAGKLAGATTKKAAKAAKKDLKATQAALKEAQAANQRAQAANAILAAQQTVTESSVQALMNGVISQNFTLAEYAEARGRVAEKLADANQALVAALQIRDSYKTQVEDSIKAFGALTTAQAAVIGGITQQLTARDITRNLEDRLRQIAAFNDNLQILLSQGLSQDAYKQLVDAGVEAGGAYADALVKGGPGSVQSVNQLTEQIGNMANNLGIDASNTLYQAGVDAAQGLVDGLTSLSAQLDSAAAQLGQSIAAAVKRALGIASPSKVMLGISENVGQTLINGLAKQESGVARASTSLGEKIAISPSLALAEQQGRVPGVGQVPPAGSSTEHHWHLSGFSDDPKAAANEAINEMTGRLL